MSARSGKVGVICIYVVNAALSLFHALTLLIGLELIMKGDRGRGNKETQASTSTREQKKQLILMKRRKISLVEKALGVQ